MTHFKQMQINVVKKKPISQSGASDLNSLTTTTHSLQIKHTDLVFGDSGKIYKYVPVQAGLN